MASYLQLENASCNVSHPFFGATGRSTAFLEYGKSTVIEKIKKILNLPGNQG
jgi:hypothetical protein